MQVLVCGSRAWTDKYTIKKELATLSPHSQIIHGGQPGADTIAGAEADKLGMSVLKYPIGDWGRDTKLLTQGGPDMILVFHPQLGKSRCTRDMVRKARQFGVPVKVIAGCRDRKAERRKRHEAALAKRRTAKKPFAPEMCMVCGSRVLYNNHEKIICTHCKSINATCCG